MILLRISFLRLGFLHGCFWFCLFCYGLFMVLFMVSFYMFSICFVFCLWLFSVIYGVAVAKKRRHPKIRRHPKRLGFVFGSHLITCYEVPHNML